MSVKSRHLLLLFFYYKITIPICVFLPALQNLKDASVVEVHSSSSQPALHSFLDCLISLVVVTSQVFFQGPKQVVVWGGQIWTVGWMGEQLQPFFWIVCKVSHALWDWQFSLNVFHEVHDEVHWVSECSKMHCFPFFWKVDWYASAAWMIGDVHVSNLTMFLSPSDTAGTHVSISIHTVKLLVYDSCWMSIFHKIFNDSTLMKWHNGDSHFPAVHDGNIRGVHAVILVKAAQRFSVLVVTGFLSQLTKVCYYSAVI